MNETVSGEKPAPVVLVTGASRGIGAAAALAFAKAGWRVAITARTTVEGQVFDHQLRRANGNLLRGSLETTAEAVRAAGAQVLTHPMDLLDASSMDTALDAVMHVYGRVDVLINNAVYQDPEMNALLLDLEDDMLERTLRGNLIAPFHLARRVLPTMAQQKTGLIINVCSGAGKYDPPLPADQGGWGFAYGASKAALIRLAGCINRELGRQGIHAYSVNPGVVVTEALTATLGDSAELSLRYGAMMPENVALALLWLASEPQARGYAKGKDMLELQHLVREFGLAGGSI